MTTINDAVLRVGELLIPIIGVMKRDLLTGGYIQADETHVDVQTPDKKGQNRTPKLPVYSLTSILAPTTGSLRPMRLGAP